MCIRDREYTEAQCSPDHHRLKIYFLYTNGVPSEMQAEEHKPEMETIKADKYQNDEARRKKYLKIMSMEIRCEITR